MSTQPFTSSRFRAFDSNGNPLSGGLLYTYAAGTTTPLATYTDASGGTPNANPVVLDASGSANVWLTPGLLYKFVLQDSTGAVQSTVDNYPSPASQTTQPNVTAIEPGGRLTLSPGNPVFTSDVTGATTLYYAPYKSDQVPLYDGTNWSLYSIGTGLSQTTTDTTKSPAAVAATSCYDVFVWNDSGTVRLSRGPAWASDTSRGTGASTTELQQVNGRYVNKWSITNGPGAQLGLYVGTVRSDGSSQLNDSLLLRHVWNNYNRVSRRMRVTDTTATWTNTTNGTWRLAHGGANTVVVDFVLGMDEGAVTAQAQHAGSFNGGTPSGNVNFATAIGLDSITTPATESLFDRPTTPSSNTTAVFCPRASYMGNPGIGRHYLSWLEIASWTSGATTVTWEGYTAGTVQTGLVAHVFG
jgi:hypothetical protein